MTISLADPAHAPQGFSGSPLILYQDGPLSVAPHDPHAPLLEYHDRDQNVPETILLKTIGSFVLGCMVMGVMLTAARAMYLNYLDAKPVTDLEFAARMLFLFGMGFVGSSLLLVVLKAREEWGRHLLHARHPVFAMGVGAGYAAAVFAPALGLSSRLSFADFASTGIWMLLLCYPVIAAFWMVVKRPAIK